jgi:D-hexose-6-phosphate mutarotase
LHGFVRQQIWSAKIDAGNPAKAVFSLSSSVSTKKIWNAEFELRYTVQIGQNTLKTTLAARNPETAKAPLIFQIALHNYLKLPSCNASLDSVHLISVS